MRAAFVALRGAHVPCKFVCPVERVLVVKNIRLFDTQSKLRGTILFKSKPANQHVFVVYAMRPLRRCAYLLLKISAALSSFVDRQAGSIVDGD